METDNSQKEIQEEKAKSYWKKNVLYLFILLVFWFVFSFGAGILFEAELSKYKIGGLPLGFWFSQQGAIYGFVIIIFVYVYLMNRLDRKFGFED